MDHISSHETSETAEEFVVRKLRERGLDDPAVYKLLLDWTINQEKQVEASFDHCASIWFEIRRAHLYLNAEFWQDGLQCLRDALTLAWNLDQDEICTAIQDQLSQIEQYLVEIKEKQHIYGLSSQRFSSPHTDFYGIVIHLP